MEIKFSLVGRGSRPGSRAWNRAFFGSGMRPVNSGSSADAFAFSARGCRLPYLVAESSSIPSNRDEPSQSARSAANRKAGSQPATEVLVSRVKRLDTEADVRLSSLAISPADLPAALNSRRRRSSSGVHFAYLVSPSTLIARPCSHMAPSDSARAAHAFCTIRSRKYVDEVQFYAFDIQVSDGEDLRTLRENDLARLPQGMMATPL